MMEQRLTDFLQRKRGSVRQAFQAIFCRWGNWHHRTPRRLLPLRQLEAVAKDEWRTTGNDATFELADSSPHPGWNMLEIACERDVTSVAAIITFETNKGSQVAEMPLRVGKVTKRLVYVPWGVRRVVFCPMNARGTFQLTHFRFVWLLPSFAHDRLAQRLINTHPQYRGLSVPAVLDTLKRQAREQHCRWQTLAFADYQTTFISLCSKHNYQQWIDQVEARRQPAQSQLRELNALASPKLGIILPVTSLTTPEALETTLASLKPQVGEWHCLTMVAEDAQASVQAVLKRWAEAHVNLDVMKMPASLQGGAAMRNLAWQGEKKCDWWLAMEAGDSLAPFALWHLAQRWRKHSTALLVICDEDYRDAEGLRLAPHFKPAWNPDLLLSTAYAGRAVVIHRDLLEMLGGYRQTDLKACGDWLTHDLLLRFWVHHGNRAEQLTTALSEVVYHRQESVSRHQAGEAVLMDALRYCFQQQGLLPSPGRGKSVKLSTGKLADSVRIHWPLPDAEPLVSLLVPTRDRVEILKPCVDAILGRTEYTNFELLILDNQSTCPEALAYMAEVANRDSRVRVLRWNHPFNYSAINNWGVEQSRGDIIGLVNNDIEPINAGWLTEMVSQACRPDIGCVGAKLYYPNDTIQHGGVILGLGGVAGHAHRFFQRDEDGYLGRLKLVQNLSAVTAACLLLRKTVFEEAGRLNEPDLAVAYNDVDLCLKVREAGYRNLWTPYAELYHHESISRGADDTPKKRARWLRESAYMRRTWGDALDHDPAYNPNLTLVHEDFSLR